MANAFSIIGRLDTSYFSSDLQSGLNKVTSSIKPITIRATVDSSGLGQISSDFKKIDAAIDSATARVAAFGATLSVFASLKFIAQSIVSEMANVEKSLIDINVILNASSGNLAKFSDGLFDVARNTGQSFSVVATAATELSRQGLTAEQTLSRVSDALILSRLSGLDAVKSVEALTAAINTFASAGIRSSDIVNRYAAVDAAFAVSSKDLADAVSRTGSAAQGAGVQFNELLAIVTSAQQQTARGGAVIGNSLKTIFTRVSRPEILDQLQEFGIKVNENQSAVEKLKTIGKELDNFSGPTAQKIKLLLGGTQQVNAVSAVLKDISRDVSLYSEALKTANEASDEAYSRNIELNKSFIALGNSFSESGKQLFSTVGNGIFGNQGKSVIKTGDSILQSANNNLFGQLTGDNSDKIVKKNAFGEGLDAFGNKVENDTTAQAVGKNVGGAILKGLGDALFGPGIIILGKAFTTIGLRTIGDLKVGLESLNGAGAALKEQEKTRREIAEAIKSATSEQQKAVAVAKTEEERQAAINALIRERAILLSGINKGGEAQASIANGGLSVASGLSGGASRSQSGGGRLGNFTVAGGIIPERRFSAAPEFAGKLPNFIQGFTGDTVADDKIRQLIPQLFKGIDEGSEKKIQGVQKRIFKIVEGVNASIAASESSKAVEDVNYSPKFAKIKPEGILGGIIREGVQYGEGFTSQDKRLRKIEASGIAPEALESAFGGDNRAIAEKIRTKASEIYVKQQQFEDSVKSSIILQKSQSDYSGIIKSVQNAGSRSDKLSEGERGTIFENIQRDQFAKYGLQAGSSSTQAILKTNLGKDITTAIQGLVSNTVDNFEKEIANVKQASKNFGGNQLKGEIQRITSGDNNLFGRKTNLFTGTIKKDELLKIQQELISSAGENESQISGVREAVTQNLNARKGFRNTANNIGGQIQKNSLTLSLGLSFASGGFDQASETLGKNGATAGSRKADVLGGVTNGAGIGLALGGSLIGLGVGAGVGLAVGLIKATDESQKALDKTTSAFERLKEASTGIDNSLQQYAATQQNLNDALKTGESISQSFFQQLQNNLAESKSKVLENASKLGAGDSQKGQLSKAFEVLFSGTSSANDKGDAQIEINKILASLNNAASLNQRVAQANVDAGISKYLPATSYNGAFATNLNKGQVLDLSSSVVKSGQEEIGSGRLSSKDLIEALDKNIFKIKQGNNNAGETSTSLLASGLDINDVRVLASLTQENRVALLESIKEQTISREASRQLSASKAEEIKSGLSLAIALKDITARIATSKIVDNARDAEGFKIDSFATAGASKLLANGLDDSSKISLNTVAAVSSVNNSFEQTVSDNNKALIDSLQKIAIENIKETGGTIRGTKGTDNAIDVGSIVSEKSIDKLQSLVVATLGDNKKGIKDVSELIANTAAKNAAAGIAKTSGVAQAQQNGSIEQTLLTQKQLASSFGGNALNFNIGDLGARLSGERNAPGTSQALLDAKKILPNANLFNDEGSRGQIRSQIQTEVLNSGANVLREAILKQNGGQANEFTNRLDSGTDILQVIKDLKDTNADLAKRIAPAIKVTENIVNSSGAIADEQIKNLSPEQKTAEQIEKSFESVKNALIKSISETAIKNLENTTATGFGNTVNAINSLDGALARLGEDIKDTARLGDANRGKKTADDNVSKLSDAVNFVVSKGGNIGDIESIKKILLNLPKTQLKPEDVLKDFKSVGGKGIFDATPEYKIGISNFSKIGGLQEAAKASPTLNSISSQILAGKSGSIADGAYIKGGNNGEGDSLILTPEVFTKIQEELADKLPKGVEKTRASLEELAIAVKQQKDATLEQVDATDKVNGVKKETLGILGLTTPGGFGAIDGAGYSKSDLERGGDKISGGKAGVPSQPVKVEIATLPVSPKVSSSGQIAEDADIIGKTFKGLSKVFEESLPNIKNFFGFFYKDNDNVGLVNFDDYLKEANKGLLEFTDKTSNVTLKDGRQVSKETADRVNRITSTRNSIYSETSDNERNGLGNNPYGSQTFTRQSDAAARLREKRDYGGGLNNNEKKALADNPSRGETAAERGLKQAAYTGDMLYDKLTNIRDISANVTTQLSQGFGEAFANAITGAQSFGEAMKGVLRSILLDLSKQFATAAFAKVVGSIVGSVAGSFAGGVGSAEPSAAEQYGTGSGSGFLNPVLKSFNGGSIGVRSYAVGGRVLGYAGGGIPVNLNRGEFVASPDMVGSYGENFFKSMNNGAFVDSGSGTKDDYATSLPPGSFVVNRENSMKYKSTLNGLIGQGNSTGDTVPSLLKRNEFILNDRAVNYYGLDSLNALNNRSASVSSGQGVKKFADGGAVDGGYKPTDFLNNDATADNNSSDSSGNQGGGGGITITINISNGGDTTSSTGGGNQKAQAEQLAAKIKAIVQDETRKGGLIDKKTAAR